MFAIHPLSLLCLAPPPSPSLFLSTKHNNSPTSLPPSHTSRTNPYLPTHYHLTSSSLPKHNAHQNITSFSGLSTNVPWDSASVVTTMVAYYGIFHIPLGLGGLSIVAELLQKKDLDLETKAVSLVLLQVMELVGSIWLFQSSLEQLKPSLRWFNFDMKDAYGSRGWLRTSTLGLGFILLIMGATVTFVEKFLHSQGGNYNSLQDLLSGSIITQFSMFIVCCLVTPCLEEFVYRGVLLRFLAARMVWPLAVAVSAFIFALGHFNMSGAPALFFVGCVLGSAYVWSGNLVASFIIHSVYNGLVLFSISLH